MTRPERHRIPRAWHGAGALDPGVQMHVLRFENRRRLALVAALAAVLLGATLAHPWRARADLPLCGYTWTNTTTEDNWDTATDWQSPSGHYVPGGDPSGGGQNPTCQGAQVSIPTGAKVDVTQDSNASATTMTIAAGAQVYINSGSSDSVLGISGAGSHAPALTNNGQIRLDGETTTRGIIDVSGSGQLTNNATIIGSGGTAGNVLQGETLINHGTIEAATSTLTLQMANHPAVNHSDGTLQADQGATLLLSNEQGSGDEFDIDGGTVTANGTVECGSLTTLVLNAGRITGANPLTLDGGSEVAPSGTGSGTLAIASNQAVQLGSDIAAGYTLTMADGGQLEAGGQTNRGTVQLASGSSHEGYITTGALTNDGTLDISSQTASGAPQFDIQTAITNNGTEEITQGSVYSQATTTQAGGTLTVDPNASFDPNTLDISGGTLNNQGTMNAGGNLAATGGTITGTPPLFEQNISLSGTGSGTIDTQNATLTSDVPSGYVLIVENDLGLSRTGGGTTVNDGTLDMVGSGSLNPNIHGGSLDNQGTVKSLASPASYRVINSTFTNEGTMEIRAYLGINENFTNAGAITISDGSTLEMQNSQSFTQTAGVTTLTGSGDLLQAQGGVTINGGTLTGAGQVEGNLTNNGTVAPTPGPDHLTVQGTYTQGAAGFLAADVGATGASTLRATATATLDGTLQVSTDASYAPPQGQAYDVVQASALSGRFATTAGLDSGPYTLAYSSSTATLTAQGRPTPPPQPTPRLSIGDVSIAAPLTGTATATFQVTMSPASTTPVTAAYTTSNGTGVASLDYQAASGTVVFAPGQTTATIPVSVLSTAGRSDTRTFFVDLAQPSGAILSNARGTGTITVAPSFDRVSPSAAGNRGTVQLTVEGRALSPNGRIVLKAAGQPDIVARNLVVSDGGGTLTATVELTGQPLGLRDVVVTMGSVTHTFAGAFRIEATRAAYVVATLIGRYTLRDQVPAGDILLLQNLGNVDAAAPLVHVSGFPQGTPVTFYNTPAPPLVTDAGGHRSFDVVGPAVPANSSVAVPFGFTPRGEPHSTVTLSAAVIPDGPGAPATPAGGSVSTDAAVSGSGYTGTIHLSGDAGSADLPFSLGTASTRGDLSFTNANGTYRFVVPASPAPGSFTPRTASVRPAARGTGILAADQAPGTDLFGELNDAKDQIDKAKAVLQFLADTKQEYGLVHINDCLLSHGKISAAQKSDLDGFVHAGFWYRLMGLGLNFVKLNAIASAGLGQAASAIEGGNARQYQRELAQDIASHGGGDLLAGSGYNPGTSSVAGLFGGNTPEQEASIDKVFANALLFYLLNCAPQPPVPTVVPATLPHQSTRSGDPNDLSGPTGAGADHWLRGDQTAPLTYTASFENLPTASAPAARVVVTDQLDTRSLNPATATLGPVTVATRVITPPPGVRTYSTRVDLRPAQNLLLAVSGSINPTSGLITWTFDSIDPLTGQPTSDATSGFLAPDTRPPAGEGSVTFSVMPRAGLPTNRRIADRAVIVFDRNAPIATPVWSNRIDRTSPSGRILSVRRARAMYPVHGRHRVRFVTRPALRVHWSGRDRGSGVGAFFLWASANGGRFTPVGFSLPNHSELFPCQPGRRYRFSVQAEDRSGNRQAGRLPASRAVRCR